MMLFISVVQGDSLLRSPLQAVTLGMTAALLLLLLRVQRSRIGAASVAPETLAWIQDLKLRPTLAEPSRACLESLDWIQRLRLSRTGLRLSPSARIDPVAVVDQPGVVGTADAVEPVAVEPAIVVEQRDDVEDSHESDDPHPHDDVRVLRLHVKSLETALDEQIERVRELGEQAHAIAPPAQDLDAVLATITGLRTSMALDPAALRVLDRVEAAVCRLGGVSTGVARPILPTRPDAENTPVETVAVEQDTTLDVPVDVGLAGDQPADEPADGPSDDITPVEETAVEVPSTPTRVPDHLVQPVPAPAPAQSAASRRRWARRLAA